MYGWLNSEFRQLVHFAMCYEDEVEEMAIVETCEYIGFGGIRREVTVEAFESRSSAISIVFGHMGDHSITFMNTGEFRKFLKMLQRFDEKLEGN